MDAEFARRHLVPDLLARHLGNNGRLEYDAEVVASGNDSTIIYRSSGQTIGETADASVTLLDGRFPNPPRGFPDGLRKGPRPAQFGRGPAAGFGPPDAPPGQLGPGPGLWRLRVCHRAGSLEALVAEARTRNLAVSGGLLLLILATVSMLVRLSRRTQQMAEQQINFVAGVSHELRTPLTVIRTAAYNLRGRLAERPEQVERYGELIGRESEKLGGLVEQILRFASAKAGHIIRRREALAIGAVIEQSLESCQAALEKSDVVFQRLIDPDLPPVFADDAALQHAIQNLVDNAIKHGAGGTRWVGVFASAVHDEEGTCVEISVVDRGPGIPASEQKQVFEPFFRGSRALADQIHGTGLGLDLVKRIVEAHGGTVRVASEPGKGTAFIVRLPALTPERQDELAPSVD